MGIAASQRVVSLPPLPSRARGARAPLQSVPQDPQVTDGDTMAFYGESIGFIGDFMGKSCEPTGSFHACFAKRPEKSCHFFPDFGGISIVEEIPENPTCLRGISCFFQWEI